MINVSRTLVIHFLHQIYSFLFVGFNIFRFLTFKYLCLNFLYLKLIDLILLRKIGNSRALPCGAYHSWFTFIGIILIQGTNLLKNLCRRRRKINFNLSHRPLLFLGSLHQLTFCRLHLRLNDAFLVLLLFMLCLFQYLRIHWFH